MLKRILPILAAALCCMAVHAQTLRDDHPDRYVVVKGDTLWDISARFLRDPWLWPEVWQVNPQIANPHLIYPGDIVSLVYIDGQPRLRLSREKKLSPHIRRSSTADAIKPIDLDQIRPFLDKRTILSDDEISGLPYVVAIQEGHLAGTENQLIYARDLNAGLGDTYAVVRPTVKFVEVPADFPWSRSKEFRSEARDWGYPAEKRIGDYVESFWNNYFYRRKTQATRVLGHEVIQTGVGEVVANGDDVSTLRLQASNIEVLEGDLIIPVFDADLDSQYLPRGMTDVPENTRVIGLSRALFASGKNQVVALNRGHLDGVQNGHVLAINRPGRAVRDEVRYPDGNVKGFFTRDGRRAQKVDLPDEYAAHVMVFKTYDHLSYALIMRSFQAVKVLDRAESP